jgi:hypothetical protein
MFKWGGGITVGRKNQVGIGCGTANAPFVHVNKRHFFTTPPAAGIEEGSSVAWRGLGRVARRRL